MQPAAAKIEREIAGTDRVRPPTDAVARFQHDNGQTAIRQMTRSRDAGRARTDHNSVNFTHKSNPRSYLSDDIYSAKTLPATAVWRTGYATDNYL
jgi:hypothetical protein